MMVNVDNIRFAVGGATIILTHRDNISSIKTFDGNSNREIAQLLSISTRKFTNIMRRFGGTVEVGAFYKTLRWLEFKNKEDAENAFEWIKSELVMKKLSESQLQLRR